MRKKQILAAAVATALSANAAHAAPDLSDIFQVHAYGTLGVAHSNQDEADFVDSNFTEPNGAGYSRSWSPRLDSKAAVQLDAHITDQLSGVVQLISENENNSTWTGQPNPPFRPSLEWANLKYQVTDNWSVRAGRMVLPYNMLSEYRNVGYSLPFIRAPVEVYAFMPYTNMDGVQVAYKNKIGGATNTVVAGVGATSLRTTLNGAYQAREYIANDTLEIGSWTVRGSYLFNPFKNPVGYGDLFQEFAIEAAQVPGGIDAADTASALGNRLNSNHWSNLQLLDLGATYDPGDWLFMIEANRYWNRGIAGSGDSGFVTVGYHYHGFTPYATYSRTYTYYAQAPVIPLAGLPADVAAQGDLLNGLVQGLVASNYSQRDVSAGLRWDFAKNLDFKVQYDYVRTDAGAFGLFVNVQPGFQLGSGASIVSLALDFAF